MKQTVNRYPIKDPARDILEDEAERLVVAAPHVVEDGLPVLVEHPVYLGAELLVAVEEIVEFEDHPFGNDGHRVIAYFPVFFALFHRGLVDECVIKPSIN